MLNLIRLVVTISICWLANMPMANSAEPCELKDGPFGYHIGDCLLSRFTEDATVTLRVPRVRFRLPNLRVRDVDVSATGVVTLEVENDGLVDAPDYPVIVGAYLNSIGGTQLDFFEILTTFPALAAGGRYETQVGALSIPSPPNNRDVTVIVLLDAVSIINPGGQVWESNEEDNYREYNCRIYGPDPDYTGPPGC